MTKPHPVHLLQATLEKSRLKAVESLAAKEGSFTMDALQELATTLAALSAVREEIERHGLRLGWGNNDALD